MTNESHRPHDDHRASEERKGREAAKERGLSLGQLDALARAVAPLRWVRSGYGYQVVSFDPTAEECTSNTVVELRPASVEIAAFIAACSPEVIRALLARVRATGQLTERLHLASERVNRLTEELAACREGA